MAEFNPSKEQGMQGEHARIKSAVDKAAEHLGYREVKDLQWKVIFEVMSGRDVFAVLPTGYGKSLCYGCLPLAFDELYKPAKPSIVCVISPLTAIIEDQVHFVWYIIVAIYIIEILCCKQNTSCVVKLLHFSSL